MATNPTTTVTTVTTVTTMDAMVPVPLARLLSRLSRVSSRVALGLSVGLACATIATSAFAQAGSPYNPMRSAPTTAPATTAVTDATGAALPPIKAPPLRAVVTIAPLRSFVEPLLPEGSQIRVLMQPGKSEHGYEFTPSDLRAIAEADVVVLVGLNLEPAIEKTLTNRKDPSRRVVRFSDVVGLESDPSTPQDHVHDPDGGCCNHGPIDPHLWLDPILCSTLVDAVRAAIDTELQERGALTEEASAALSARQAHLKSRVAQVDQAWRAAAPQISTFPIVTHHNAYPRLAERYGLKIAAVIRDIPTAEPSPAQVANVARTIREQGVRTIYIEPQFSRKLADRIAKAAGVSIATLDPLGTGDWFALMDANLASLRANSPVLEPTPAATGSADASTAPSAQ